MGERLTYPDQLAMHALSYIAARRAWLDEDQSELRAVLSILADVLPKTNRDHPIIGPLVAAADATLVQKPEPGRDTLDLWRAFCGLHAEELARFHLWRVGQFHDALKPKEAA